MPLFLDECVLHSSGVQSEPNFGLAPMEGVSDLPLRLWMYKASNFDFAMTPFLRVTKEYPVRRIPSTFAPESSVLKGAVGYRVIPQIMGCDTPDLLRIAEFLLATSSHVDFNCGCPSPTVVGNGAGSGLLEKPDVFNSYVQEFARSLGSERFSIKMRAGFSTLGEFENLLDVVVRHRPRVVTLHARTRAQRYQGKADWQLVQQAISSGLQIVGSGDIVSLASFQERFHLAHGQNFLVGRGALRNPFLFQNLKTGNSVQVHWNLLRCMLTCFALLQQMYESDPQGLLQFVGTKGLFVSSSGNDLESWMCLEEGLRVEPCLQSFLQDGVHLTRGTLSKVKMIWNYLRTGLPTKQLDKESLRAADFESFLKCVLNCLWDLRRDPDPSTLPEFEFVHNACHDWIFSGEKMT
jgi:tRNA-dihydrouridine synthase